MGDVHQSEPPKNDVASISRAGKEKISKSTNRYVGIEESDKSTVSGAHDTLPNASKWIND